MHCRKLKAHRPHREGECMLCPTKFSEMVLVRSFQVQMETTKWTREKPEGKWMESKREDLGPSELREDLVGDQVQWQSKSCFG